MKKPLRTLRVVAAMESHRNEPVIDLAERLSRALESEVLGLYVEDEEVLSAASLPFTRSISPISGELSNLQPEDLARAFRAGAENLRRTLMAAGVSGRASWSLEVIRGAGRTAALTHAGEMDLLVVRRDRQGRIADLIRSGVACSLALAPSETAERRAPRHVVALYRGEAATLRLAARLASENGALAILIVDSEPAQRRALRRRARSWLARNAVPGTVDALEPEQAGLLLRRLGSGILVARMPGEDESEVLESLVPEPERWSVVLLRD